MRILALESSAGPASAAVWEDGRLLGESFVNIKQTHSQTLLPMTQRLLAALGLQIADLDAIAVANGPGSFTGVRIAVACAKGLALPGALPCCGVSTLEVIALGGLACEGAVVCAVMDARVGQVYNALFRVEGGALRRLTEDRALSIAQLGEERAFHGKDLILFGDGAALCHESFQTWGARLAPEPIRYQRAASVALAASALVQAGKTVSAGELLPTYLRPPQAERELRQRQEGKR